MLLGAFIQEEVLVGAFSMIIQLQTSRGVVSSSILELLQADVVHIIHSSRQLARQGGGDAADQHQQLHLFVKIARCCGF